MAVQSSASRSRSSSPGALLAAVTDLSFNLWGYTAVVGNDFMTALYLIMVKNTPTASTLTTTVRCWLRMCRFLKP